jgi:flavin reductase (DIM6/NTAB) family NADH-FMN oxidoreductase RutF
MAQAGGTGPIGPYPPSVADSDDARDEYDRMRRRLMWKMPSGLYVVGTTDRDERRNGMTLNWATQISFDPKLIGISVEHSALTHELIDASGVFVLNLIAREDRAIVRKFTKPVEVDVDARTLNGFPYVEKVTGAPVLAQAVAYLDCEVRERLEAGNHTFFVGEVVDCSFLEDEETEVLRMEDTRMSYGG